MTVMSQQAVDISSLRCKIEEREAWRRLDADRYAHDYSIAQSKSRLQQSRHASRELVRTWTHEDTRHCQTALADLQSLSAGQPVDRITVQKGT